LSSLKGKDLDRAATSLLDTLNHTTMPMYDKNRYRNELQSLKTLAAKEERQSGQESLTQLLVQADSLIADITSGKHTGPLILQLNSDINSAAIKKAADKIVAACPQTPVLLFSIDTVKNTVQVVASLSKEVADKGFHANSWAKTFVDIVGGKSGGKELTAQGVGIDTTKVEQATTAAREFASRKD